MIDFLLGVPGKLKTISDWLTTYWTAARAAYLDAAISSRAAASTALTSAMWTDAKAGFIDGAISGRLGSIKSIQTPGVTIAAAGSWSVTTITSVNTAKTILIPLGGQTGASTITDTMAYFTLSSATSVRADRQGTGGALYVKVMVVEFN